MVQSQGESCCRNLLRSFVQKESDEMRNGMFRTEKKVYKKGSCERSVLKKCVQFSTRERCNCNRVTVITGLLCFTSSTCVSVKCSLRKKCENV